MRKALTAALLAIGTAAPLLSHTTSQFPLTIQAPLVRMTTPPRTKWS